MLRSRVRSRFCASEEGDSLIGASCVCVFICTGRYTHACMHAYMYVCAHVHVRLYVRLYVCMYVFKFMYIRMHADACLMHVSK